MPEVSLVAILDADKQGFLRSIASLIQTIGRAARHIEGKAILYGDQITPAMQVAMDETERRRQIQLDYNQAHGITPKTITKAQVDLLDVGERGDESGAGPALLLAEEEDDILKMAPHQLSRLMKNLKKDMLQASESLDFEAAAQLRDRIHAIEALLMKKSP